MRHLQDFIYTILWNEIAGSILKHYAATFNFNPNLQDPLDLCHLMLALAHMAEMMVPVWALSTITTIRPAGGFKIENDADCNNSHNQACMQPVLLILATTFCGLTLPFILTHFSIWDES